MNPSEEDFDDLENKIYDLESSVSDIKIEIDDINYDIEELKFSKEDYEIYLFPTTVQRYLKNLIELQQNENETFFPSSESRIREYFNTNFGPFDHNQIKYSSTEDLKTAGKIISYQGRSGSSFIENIDNVIDINKPLLLFYGIEQLAAYYSNLHFNFTWTNNNLSAIRNDLLKHGIGAFQFKNPVDLSNPIDDLLNKKIKLQPAGLAQRFFLAIAPGFLRYFSEKVEISLIELLKFFYLFIPIPYKTKRIFEELYGSRATLPRPMIDFYDTHGRDLDLYLIYLLSFLLCHMCRYKLYDWTLLLNSEKKNIGYFIKYFLQYSRNYFIQKLFDKIYKTDEVIKDLLRHPSSSTLLI